MSTNGILEDWRYRHLQEEEKKAEAFARSIDHWKENVGADELIYRLDTILEIVQNAADRGDKMAQRLLDEIVESVRGRDGD